MTRKKSNVKALAFAVTCAILAGGYSGLNPVYAETPVKITPAGTISGDTTSGYTFAGTEITISGSTIAGALDGIDISKSYVDGTKTLKTLNEDVATNSAATQANATSITNNTNKINNVDSKYEAITNNIKTEMSTQVSTINTKIDTKLDTSTFGAYTASNDAAVNELKNKTQNIRFAKDTKVTSSDATYIDGITHAGGVRLADNGVRAKELVLEEEFADGTSAQATLTREGIVTLNGLSNGSSGIKAGNGSEVGGVTFDNKNITNINNATVDNILKVKTIQSIDGNNEITVEEMATTKSNTAKITYEGGATYINQGDDQQVVIDDKGLKVGKNSSRMNDITGFATSKNLYVGTADADNPTKDNSKFYVDGATGETVVKGSAGTTTIYDGAITIDEPITPGTPSESIQLSKGTVLASASVISPKFFVDPNNAFEKNSLKVGDGTKGVTIADGEITTTGDATVGGNLSVAGTSTFTGKTTFSGGINTDTIDEATADKGVTVDGVLLKDKGIDAADGKFTVDGVTGDTTVGGKLDVTGNITGADITASGALKGSSLNVTNDAAVGGKLDVTGNATVGGDLAVAKNIKGQSLNIGATGNEFTVDTVGKMTSKSANIGSVGITDTGVITGVTSLTTDALTVTGAFTTGGNLTVTGDLSASGAIKGKTISITDGGSIAGVSFATGGNLTATTGTIAGVSFAAGGDVSGVHDLTASGTIQGATLKVNDKNLLDNNGLKAEKAVIDSVVIDDASITSTGANGLDVEKVNLKNGAITADKATIGGVNKLDNTGIKVATGSTIQVGVNTVIEDGSIAVSTNTTLTDQALNLNAANKWTAAGGLEADKAAINGVTIGETAGKAVFNNAGKSTTIDGDTIQTGKITADELLIDKISLGKGGSSNITIDKDGHVKTKGDITITDAAGNVMSKLSQDQATFGKDAENQTNINNGKLKAKAKNTANQQAKFNFDENGLTVSGQNAAGDTSSFGFNAATGIGTFTGQDGTTTAINGSSITSTNGAAAGVLNGSSLTLNDGTNSTALNAGGATFTGDAGEKGGKVTTINGGTITTDTLNVERINLGGEVIDKGAAGVEANSKLYMDAQGNFRAAGGNFKVTGADGAMTNTVGNTTLQTDNTGASMNYAGTANSNISVADGKAEMAVGTNAAVTATDGKVEIKGGTQTVTTTDAGTVFENSAHNTPFVTGGAANTIINGNEITTGKLTTDQLVITGSGAAAGAGTIALGGDGSIKSNIKDTTTGKEATFQTNADGTFTEAKDGANVTTNTVNAQGNTNKVTDGTNTSTVTQTATSIGGVVTNGTVTMKQELTAEGVKVTDELGDPANYTQITDKDVSITDPKNTGKRINLSDLGQLNDLDGELTARSEYTSNPTAVGAINAEAGIRREEVARLDNRIDDVNNRVDKVGAMAAAIASLKSIGYDPQAPSEFSIGLGQYKGETGVAMGFFHYPNKNFMINVSLSTAGGETMGGIGATWRFGHKSPQKLLEEQREAQARKELAAAEKYQAAAKLAKEAQERAEYAAKLARQAQVSADNAKAAADATQAKHF